MILKIKTYLFVLALAVVLATTFTGCHSKTDDSSETGQMTNSVIESQSEEDPQAGSEDTSEAADGEEDIGMEIYDETTVEIAEGQEGVLK